MNSEKQSTNLQMTLREVNRVGEGQKNVPKLRFKGYEDAWEQRKLGSDINVTSVKRVHQSDWETEGVPFYRARDIVSEFKGEEISEPIFVSKKTYEEFSRISGKVQADDLLVTGVGTIGVPYLVKSNNPLYFKDGNVIWIQNNKKLDGYFLFYTFITNPIQNFIRESAGTGTVGTLTIETCKRIPVFIPGKREQIAVGEFFQSLDNLITLHQRKYDALKSMKKTLLSKMFPKNGEDVPEIRFKEFTDAWEQRKLGEVLDFSLKTNSLSRSMLNYEEGELKNIHYGDILMDYGPILNFKTDTIPYITEGKVEEFTSQLLINGDVVFADAAEDESVGKAIEINGLEEQCLVSGLHTIVGRPTIKFAERFLGYYINSNSYHNQLLPLMQGTKVSSISKTTLQKTMIIYPKVNSEQLKIGSFFYCLESIITLHQRKLEELKNMKKTLLQQMFV